MPNDWQGDPRTIRRGPPPPAQRRPFYPIHKVIGKSPTRFLILSDSIMGVYVHSIAWRTRPCLGEHGECRVNHADHPPRWQGWLWVAKANTKGFGLTWLTVEAVESMPELRVHDGDLRGMQIDLCRASDSREAIQLGTLHTALPRLEFPAAPPDLLEVVNHILRAPDRRAPGEMFPARPYGDDRRTDGSNGRATS